nr:hypothetical protein [Paracidovorax cattleyae]
MLAGEGVVRLGNVFQREAVGDDFVELEAPGLDVLDEPGPVALHAGLAHAQGQVLVHGIADGHAIEGGAVHADDRHGAALAHGVDAPVQHRGRAALQLESNAREGLRERARGLAAHGIDAHVGPQAVGHVLEVHGHAGHALEALGFAGRVLAHEIEAARARARPGARARDAHDGIAGMFDVGLGVACRAYAAGAVAVHCQHGGAAFRVVGGVVGGANGKHPRSGASSGARARR